MRRFLLPLLLLILYSYTFPFPSFANHSCGNTSDEFTKEGASTHGCGQSSHGGEENTHVESVPAEKGTDGGNRDTAVQTVQKYDSGDKDKDYAVDAKYFPDIDVDNDGVTTISEVQQDLANDVEQVQQEVEGKAAAVTQESETGVAAKDCYGAWDCSGSEWCAGAGSYDKGEAGACVAGDNLNRSAAEIVVAYCGAVGVAACQQTISQRPDDFLGKTDYDAINNKQTTQKDIIDELLVFVGGPPSPEATGGEGGAAEVSEISAAAKVMLAEQTKRCSAELLLCPMIDPETLQVVGWVPAKEAVFGNYDLARLARMNVIVGTGYKKVDVDGDGDLEVVYDWSGTLQQESLAGLSLKPEEIARIKAEAEKWQVQTDASGYMVVDQRYNTEEFKQRVEAFYDEQNQILEANYDRVVGTEAGCAKKNGLGQNQKCDEVQLEAYRSEILQGHVDACAQAHGGVVCGGTDLFAYIEAQTAVEFLPREDQDELRIQIAVIGDSDKKVKEALARVEQFLQTSNDQLPVRQEGLDLFWQEHQEFFAGLGLNQEETDRVKSSAGESIMLTGGYMAKANEALATNLGQIISDCLRIKNGNPLCTKDEAYARLSTIANLPVEYQEAVRVEVKRLEAVNRAAEQILEYRQKYANDPFGLVAYEREVLKNLKLEDQELVRQELTRRTNIGRAAGELAQLPQAQDPSQVGGLKQKQAEILTKFNITEPEDKAAAYGLAEVIAKDMSQKKLERLQQTVVEVVPQPALVSKPTVPVYEQRCVAGQRGGCGQVLVGYKYTPEQQEQIRQAVAAINPGLAGETADLAVSLCQQTNDPVACLSPDRLSGKEWGKLEQMMEPSWFNTYANLGIINDEKISQILAGEVKPSDLQQNLALQRQDLGKDLLIRWNDAAMGSVKRGAELQKAAVEDPSRGALSWDYVRGGLMVGALPAAVAVVIAGTAGIPLISLVVPAVGATIMSVPALTTVSTFGATSLGIASTTYSLAHTAEACPFDGTTDKWKCGLAAGNTALMAAFTGTGVISGQAQLANALALGRAETALTQAAAGTAVSEVLEDTVAPAVQTGAQAYAGLGGATIRLAQTPAFQAAAKGVSGFGTLVFGANAVDACVLAENKDALSCGINLAFTAISAGRLVNPNPTGSFSRNIGLADKGVNSVMAAAACTRMVTGGGDPASCVQSLGFAGVAAAHPLHDPMTEKPPAAEMEAALKVYAESPSKSAREAFLTAYDMAIRQAAETNYLLTYDPRNPVEKLLGKSNPTLEALKAAQATGDYRQTLLAYEQVLAGSDSLSKAVEILAGAKARVEVLEVRLEMAKNDARTTPELLAEIEANLAIARNQLAAIEPQVNQRLAESARERVANYLDRVSGGLARVNVLEAASAWVEGVSDRVSFSRNEFTRLAAVAEVAYGGANRWEVMVPENVKLGAATRAKLEQVNEVLREIETSLGKEFRGQEFGEKNQVKIIVDALLNSGRTGELGSLGKLYEAFTGIGKTEVIIPALTAAKAKLTGKTVMTVLDSQGKLEQFVTNLVATGKPIVDMTAAELTGVEAQLSAKLGGKVLILSDQHSLAEVADPSVKIVLATKDVIFDSIRNEAKAAALMNKLRGGVLLADEAQQSLRLELDYVISQGKAISLTGSAQAASFAKAVEAATIKQALAVLHMQGVEAARNLLGIKVVENGRSFISDEAVRNQIDRELAALAGGDVEEFLRLRSAVASMVDMLGKQAGMDIQVKDGRPVLAENNVVSDRSPSQSYDALALEDIGRRLIYASNDAELKAALSLQPQEVSITPEALATNYAIFLRNFSEIYGFTGTPRYVADQFKYIYGIELKVEPSGISQLENIFKGRITTSEQLKAAGSLREAVAAATGELGDTGVMHLVLGAKASTADTLVALQQLLPGVEIVVRQSDGTSWLVTGADRQPLANKTAVDAKLAQARAGGKLIQLYEHGAHEGTDATTAAADVLAVITNDRTTATTVSQSIGRGRSGQEKLVIINIGDRPAEALYAATEKQFVAELNLAAVKKVAENMVPTTLENMRQAALKSFGVTGAGKARINELFNKLQLDYRAVADLNPNLEDSSTTGAKDFLESVNRARQFLAKLEQNQELPASSRAVLDKVVAGAPEVYTQESLAQLAGAAKKEPLNQIRNLNQFVASAWGAMTDLSLADISVAGRQAPERVVAAVARVAAEAKVTSQVLTALGEALRSRPADLVGAVRAAVGGVGQLPVAAVNTLATVVRSAMPDVVRDLTVEEVVAAVQRGDFEALRGLRPDGTRSIEAWIRSFIPRTPEWRLIGSLQLDYQGAKLGRLSLDQVRADLIGGGLPQDSPLALGIKAAFERVVPVSAPAQVTAPQPVTQAPVAVPPSKLGPIRPQDYPDTPAGNFMRRVEEGAVLFGYGNAYIRLDLISLGINPKPIDGESVNAWAERMFEEYKNVISKVLDLQNRFGLSYGDAVIALKTSGWDYDRAVAKLKAAQPPKVEVVGEGPIQPAEGVGTPKVVGLTQAAAGAVADFFTELYGRVAQGEGMVAAVKAAVEVAGGLPVTAVSSVIAVLQESFPDGIADLTPNEVEGLVTNGNFDELRGLRPDGKRGIGTLVASFFDQDFILALQNLRDAAQKGELNLNEAKVVLAKFGFGVGTPIQAAIISGLVAVQPPAPVAQVPGAEIPAPAAAPKELDTQARREIRKWDFVKALGEIVSAEDIEDTRNGQHVRLKGLYTLIREYHDVIDLWFRSESLEKYLQKEKERLKKDVTSRFITQAQYDRQVGVLNGLSPIEQLIEIVKVGGFRVMFEYTPQFDPESYNYGLGNMFFHLYDEARTLHDRIINIFGKERQRRPKSKQEVAEEDARLRASSLDLVSSSGGKGTIAEDLVVKEGYRIGTNAWLYPPGEYPHEEPLVVDLSQNQGELIPVSVEYKVHISASEKDYDAIVREMTVFLRENGVAHKVWPGKEITQGGKIDQYGKAITVYATQPATLQKITAKARELGKKYAGISPESLTEHNANLQYELAVPETNNILYYTVEMVNNHYLAENISVSLPDATAIDGGYKGRREFMERTWGQGPLDSLWNTNPYSGQQPPAPARSTGAISPVVRAVGDAAEAVADVPGIGPLAAAAAGEVTREAGVGAEIGAAVDRAVGGVTPPAPVPASVPVQPVVPEPVAAPLRQGSEGQAPIAVALPECVTGDTKLRRRRRKKSSENSEDSEDQSIGASEYQDIRIDEIKAGDEIQSLNEASGEFEWSRVRRLMDKGVQQVWEVTTESGKTIRTTSEHPYLILPGASEIMSLSGGEGHIGPATFSTAEAKGFNLKSVSHPGSFVTGGSALHSAFSIFGLDSPKIAVFIDAANLEKSVEKIGFKVHYKRLRKLISSIGSLSHIGYFTVATGSRRNVDLRFSLLRLGYSLVTKPLKLIKDKRGLIKKADVDVEITTEMLERKDDYDVAILFSGDSDYYFPVRLLQQKYGKKIIVVSTKYSISKELLKQADSFVDIAKLTSQIARGLQKSPSFATGGSDVTSESSLTTATVNIAASKLLVKGGRWVKVRNLRVGQIVAAQEQGGQLVAERVVQIFKGKRESVYDVEIEGTHNFVGNGIVAHNTQVAESVPVPAPAPVLAPVVEREMTEDEARQRLVEQIDGFSSREEFYGRVRLLAEAIKSQYPADFPVMIRFNHEGGMSPEAAKRIDFVVRVKVADLDEELTQKFREFEAGRGAPAWRKAVIFMGRSGEFIAQISLDRWANPGDRIPDQFHFQPEAISRQEMLDTLGSGVGFGGIGKRLAALADWTTLQLHKPGELPRAVVQRQVIEGGRIWLDKMEEGEEWSIGRQGVIKFSDLVKDVSRQHAVLTKDKQGYLLTDMRSTFGTRIYRLKDSGGVEETRLQANEPVRLAEGDIVQFGPHHQMKFTQDPQYGWYLDGSFASGHPDFVAWQKAAGVDELEAARQAEEARGEVVVPMLPVLPEGIEEVPAPALKVIGELTSVVGAVTDLGWNSKYLANEDAFGTPEGLMVQNQSREDVANKSVRDIEDRMEFRPLNLTEEQLKAFGRLYSVSDGAGGAELRGFAASKPLIEALFGFYYDMEFRPDLRGSESVTSRLRAAIEEANKVVFEKTEGAAYATVTAVVQLGGKVVVANVGDSRTYILSDGIFKQVTKDHSLVQALIDINQLTPEEARVHPQRNVMTRTVGKGETVGVDVFDVEVKPGDRLVLLGDGIVDLLPDGKIAEIVGGVDPREAAASLVSAANLVEISKKRDNLTAVVVEVKAAQPAPVSQPAQVLFANLVGGLADIAGAVRDLAEEQVGQTVNLVEMARMVRWRDLREALGRRNEARSLLIDRLGQMLPAATEVEFGDVNQNIFLDVLRQTQMLPDDLQKLGIDGKEYAQIFLRLRKELFGKEREEVVELGRAIVPVGEVRTILAELPEEAQVALQQLPPEEMWPYAQRLGQAWDRVQAARQERAREEFQQLLREVEARGRAVLQVRENVAESAARAGQQPRLQLTGGTLSGLAQVALTYQQLMMPTAPLQPVTAAVQLYRAYRAGQIREIIAALQGEALEAERPRVVAERPEAEPKPEAIADIVAPVEVAKDVGLEVAVEVVRSVKPTGWREIADRLRAVKDHVVNDADSRELVANKYKNDRDRFVNNFGIMREFFGVYDLEWDKGGQLETEYGISEAEYNRMVKAMTKAVYNIIKRNLGKGGEPPSPPPGGPEGGIPTRPGPVEPTGGAPLAALPLQLAECVTGDTKLRRRRRKKSSENSEDSEDQSIGVSEYQDIRIDEIQPGDEIQSLNEATGEFEWSRVKRLMDKGVQTVWQLTTESGKTIRTTAEHPYLVDIPVKKETPQFVFVDEVGTGKDPNQPIFGVGALVMTARGEEQFVLVQQLRNIFMQAVHALKVSEDRFEFKFKSVTETSLPYYLLLLDCLKRKQHCFSFFCSFETHEAKQWEQYLRLVSTVVGMGRSIAHGGVIVLADYLHKPKAASLTLASLEAPNGPIVKTLQLEAQGSILLQLADMFVGALNYALTGKEDRYKRRVARAVWEIMEAKKKVDTDSICATYNHRVLDVSLFVKLQTKRAGIDPIYAAPRKSISYHDAAVKSTIWTKVKNLKVGQMIAVMDENGRQDWEKVRVIERVGRKQVYDIEIEATHNFVGNGIVAHNTNRAALQGDLVGYLRSGGEREKLGQLVQDKVGVETAAVAMAALQAWEEQVIEQINQVVVAAKLTDQAEEVFGRVKEKFKPEAKTIEFFGAEFLDLRAEKMFRDKWAERPVKTGQVSVAERLGQAVRWAGLATGVSVPLVTVGLVAGNLAGQMAFKPPALPPLPQPAVVVEQVVQPPRVEREVVAEAPIRQVYTERSRSAQGEPEAVQAPVVSGPRSVDMNAVTQVAVEQARLNRDIGGAANYDVALEGGIGYTTIHMTAQAGAEVAMRKVFDLHRQVNYAGRAVETLSAGERFMYELTKSAFEGVTDAEWKSWLKAENMDGARYNQALTAIRGLVAESQGSVEADVAAGKVLGFGSTRSEQNWGDKMAVFGPDGTYVGLVLIVDEPVAGDWYGNLSTAIYRDEVLGDLHWIADVSQEVYNRLPQGREARGGRPAIVVRVDKIEDLAKESSEIAGNLALPLPVGLLTALWQHRLAVRDILAEAWRREQQVEGERASGVVKAWWQAKRKEWGRLRRSIALEGERVNQINRYDRQFVPRRSVVGEGIKFWWQAMGDLDRQLRVWEGLQGQTLRIENIPGFLANGGKIKFTTGKTYTAANAQEFTQDLQDPSNRQLYGRTATITGPGFTQSTTLILGPDSFVYGLEGGSGQTAPLPAKFGPQRDGTFNVGVYQQVGRVGEIVVQAGNDVSRWHFQFVKDPLGWVAIEDLDSSSGTWINNQKIVKITRVKEGDIITIGYSSPKSFKIRRIDYGNGVVTLEPSRSTAISLSAEKTLYLKREIAILNGQSVGTRGNVLVQTDKDGRSRTSRKHAVIEIGWGKVTVRDQGSTNGTFVNGQEISIPTQLRPGDLVSLGDESNSLKFVRTEGNKAIFSQASGRFENANPKATIYSKNWADKIENILIRPWLGVSHQTVATLLERELQVNGWEMSRAEQLAETFKDKIKGKDGERLSRPERNAILLRLNMPDIKRWRPFGLASVSDAELLYVAARIAQREYSFAKAAGVEYSEIDKQANAFTTKLELFAGEIGLDLSTTYQESALVGSETKAVGGIGGTWYGLQVGSLDNFFVSEKDISSSQNPAQVALEVVLHERGHRDQSQQNWHPWGKSTYNEASTQAMVFLMIEEINKGRVTFNSYANQGANLYVSAVRKLQTQLRSRGGDPNLAWRAAIASARTGKYDGDIKLGSQRHVGIRSLFDKYFGKGAFDRHMSGESDYNIARQYHGVTVADIFFERLFPRRQASRSYKELQGQALKEGQTMVFESRVVPAPKGLVRVGEGWISRLRNNIAGLMGRGDSLDYYYGLGGEIEGVDIEPSGLEEVRKLVNSQGRGLTFGARLKNYLEKQPINLTLAESRLITASGRDIALLVLASRYGLTPNQVYALIDQAEKVTLAEAFRVRHAALLKEAIEAVDKKELAVKEPSSSGDVLDFLNALTGRTDRPVGQFNLEGPSGNAFTLDEFTRALAANRQLGHYNPGLDRQVQDMKGFAREFRRRTAGISPGELRQIRKALTPPESLDRILEFVTRLANTTSNTPVYVTIEEFVDLHRQLEEAAILADAPPYGLTVVNETSLSQIKDATIRQALLIVYRALESAQGGIWGYHQLVEVQRMGVGETPFGSSEVINLEPTGIQYPFFDHDSIKRDLFNKGYEASPEEIAKQVLAKVAEQIPAMRARGARPRDIDPEGEYLVAIVDPKRNVEAPKIMDVVWQTRDIFFYIETLRVKEPESLFGYDIDYHPSTDKGRLDGLPAGTRVRQTYEDREWVKNEDGTWAEVGPETTIFESTAPQGPKGLVRVGEGWAEQFRNWLADKQPRWYQRWNTVLYQLQQWGIYRGEIVHESYESGFGLTESRGLGGKVVFDSYLGVWKNNYPGKDVVRYWEDIVERKQVGEDLVVVDLGSGAGNFGSDLLSLWEDPQAAIEVPAQLEADLDRMRQLVVKAKSKGLRLKYVGITDAQVGQRLFDVVWEKEIEGAKGINLAFTFIGNQRLQQVLQKQGVQRVDIFMDILFSTYLRPETRKVVAQDVIERLNPGGVVLAQRILFESVDVAQSGGKLTRTDGIGVVAEKEPAGLQGQTLKEGRVEVVSGELVRSSRKEIVVGLVTREIRLVVEGNSQEEILAGIARQLDEIGVISGTEFTLRVPIVAADAAPTTVELRLRYTRQTDSLQGQALKEGNADFDRVVATELNHLVDEGIISKKSVSQANQTQIEEFVVRHLLPLRKGEADEETKRKIATLFGEAAKEGRIADRGELIGKIRELRSRLSEDLQVHGLLLYGSRMDPNKSPRPDSDIDMIVVTTTGVFNMGEAWRKVEALTKEIFSGEMKINNGIFPGEFSLNSFDFSRAVNFGEFEQFPHWGWNADAVYFVGPLTGGILGEAISEEEVNRLLKEALESETSKLQKSAIIEDVVNQVTREERGGVSGESLAERVDERIDKDTDCLSGAWNILPVAYAVGDGQGKPCPIWERVVVKGVEKGEGWWKTILALAGLGVSGGSRAVPVYLPSPSSSPVPNQCQLSGELGETAQGMKNKIKKGYDVDIFESDLCHTVNYQTSSNWLTRPWLPSELQVVNDTLEKLNRSCFLDKVSLVGIRKMGSTGGCDSSVFKVAENVGINQELNAGHRMVNLCYDRARAGSDKLAQNDLLTDSNTGYLQDVLIHEIAHGYTHTAKGIDTYRLVLWGNAMGYFPPIVDPMSPDDQQFGMAFLMNNDYRGGFFHPTEMAKANIFEDVAESVRLYVNQPGLLKDRSQWRYDHIKDNLFCGYEY